MEATKTCCRCYTRKPLSEFYANKHAKDGHAYRCKECQRGLSRSWWSRNGKKSYADHKEQQRQWRIDNSEKYAARQRRYWMRKKYAMTEADFQAKVAEQDARCAICRERAELVIDHCHARGNVRELLCQPCNKGLGCFTDSPQKLRLAAEYLEKHQDAKD